MPTPSRRLLIIAVLALITPLAACGGTPASPAPSPTAPAQPTPAQPTPSPDATGSPATPQVSPGRPSDEPLKVVTSTTVLADFVRQVGGERVDVHALIPAGRDVHTFDPAPSDAARLAEADLVVINGLELDDWLEDLAIEVAPGAALVALGENLEGVDYIEGRDDDDDDDHDDDDHDDEHDHALNPHLWLDVALARELVDRLSSTLAALDAQHAELYQSNSAGYDARLAELDDWIRDEMLTLPEDNRRVITFHDAFPYFARAYGLEIEGVIIESPGQEPSAGELARLLSAIRGANVRAILTEIQFDDRLAQIVSEETGVNVVQGLYTDSLGDPPLDTYEATMRWNAEQILAALR